MLPTGQPSGRFGRFFPPGTRTELWAGLGLVLVALVGATWVLHGRAEVLALERDPVTVEGKVVRLWTTKENNGSHYRVEYEYVAPPDGGGQVVRGETQVLKAHYDLLREGGPLPVQVCRTDPANHQVLGGRPRAFASPETMRVPLGFVGLLALAGAVNLWWWCVSRRRSAAARVFVVQVQVN